MPVTVAFEVLNPTPAFVTSIVSPIANGNLVSVEAYPVLTGILNCASKRSSTVTSVPL